MISLLAAATTLSTKLVSLHNFILGGRCRLISQACLPSRFRSWRPLPPCLPSLSPFMLSLLAAALSAKLVSLHEFVFGGRCRLISQACLPSKFRSWRPLPPCLPSLSPFMLSLLAAAAALSPKPVSLQDFALGGRCRLVSQACLPSCFRSWLPLPPCLPSLSRCKISLLGAPAALSPKLVSLHAFALGGRCRLVCQGCLPS